MMWALIGALVLVAGLAAVAAYVVVALVLYLRGVWAVWGRR